MDSATEPLLNSRVRFSNDNDDDDDSDDDGLLKTRSCYNATAPISESHLSNVVSEIMMKMTTATTYTLNDDSLMMTVMICANN
jgi:hypothetical protein